MKFGYLSGIGEITPNIFAKASAVSKAKIFITLYNANVERDMQIPLHYAKFKNIKKIFKAHIDELLTHKSINAKVAWNFCLVSNVIIRAYLDKNFEILKFIAKEPKYPVAKLIKMLYITGDFEICFDANEMFFHFVYDKISKKHLDKDIVFQNGIISIFKNKEHLLSVMPSFKHINLDDMRNINDEIYRAVGAINSKKCEKIYIVFPRNNKFKHHIDIKHCDCVNGSIRLVPYTISNKIF
ncbi:hypothetical protein KDD93_02765 [Campylobacter sp. faydin G-24]|uniref:Uncharacterized protein n=1 Tax=Campylobacter anatolicus TaxID=2829105 RepID=A0ABS5HGU3_9BACT|nr:hypothetical protein [Campylobacter anatolicus]MBR8463491.1 hypothetical protein [Campylobacter anatolicus]